MRRIAPRPEPRALPLAVLALLASGVLSARAQVAPALQSVGSTVATSATPAPTHGDGANLIASRLPRVTDRGGPFVRRPRVVTITFVADDPALVATLERFGETITRTSWWHAVTAGYCVASRDCIEDGRPARAVRLDETLPASLHVIDVEAIVRRAAEGKRLGVLDAETLLLVHLPRDVALRDAFVARYCAGGARALHRALRLSDVTVPLAVIPRCGGVGETTAAASHEILEATTSPDPARPGFAFERTPATIAFLSSGAEPADPCGLLTMDRHRAEVDGFVVQRAWSNAAASAGHDPCVPASAGRRYLALVPDQPTARLASVGDSVTIGVVAAADRPAGRWRVSAIDLGERHGDERSLDVALDTTSVTSGQRARLTITARRRPAKAKPMAIVGLVSDDGEREQLWPLAVMLR